MKHQLPSRIKKTEPEKLPEKPPRTDEGRIFALAKQWAELHAKPKTRDQMDALLEGLPEPDQRRVYLLGQRLAAGLPFKLAK